MTESNGKRVTIDVTTIRTSKELHLLLKDQLGFPNHYGENWAAFWDVITDENGLPDIVKFVGWDVLTQRLPDDAGHLKACFTDYGKEAELKPCHVMYDSARMVILPSHALQEGEALRLIHRHVAGATFPLRVERKTSIRQPKRHRFSTERWEASSVTEGIVDNLEAVDSWLTLSDDENQQDVVIFSDKSDWLLSYYPDGLTLQGTQIEVVEPADTADYETFFQHLIRGAYPIELTFCLSGTFGPTEKVYRLTLNDTNWERLIEEELLPQLDLPKTRGFWQSLARPTEPQTGETFLGEFHPNIFGNFVLAHSADDCYHFFDHINLAIKRF
ncbi:barstar family protein [Exiguobacterium sp. s16]|uniref:barstar family protein n=1 Tax=Exiguobacterium sp. s16 TaxID=2751237 RepID=UPI001BECAEC4|nr:barstar family protein [Exiguobacterium sp. s16]